MGPSNCPITSSVYSFIAVWLAEIRRLSWTRTYQVAGNLSASHCPFSHHVAPSRVRCAFFRRNGSRGLMLSAEQVDELVSSRGNVNYPMNSGRSPNCLIISRVLRDVPQSKLTRVANTLKWGVEGQWYPPPRGGTARPPGSYSPHKFAPPPSANAQKLVPSTISEASGRNLRSVRLSRSAMVVTCCS